jgi:hypothetical protein
MRSSRDSGPGPRSKLSRSRYVISFSWSTGAGNLVLA